MTKCTQKSFGQTSVFRKIFKFLKNTGMNFGQNFTLVHFVTNVSWHFGAKPKNTNFSIPISTYLKQKNLDPI
jgi:hypothetical protein